MPLKGPFWSLERENKKPSNKQETCGSQKPQRHSASSPRATAHLEERNSSKIPPRKKRSCIVKRPHARSSTQCNANASPLLDQNVPLSKLSWLALLPLMGFLLTVPLPAACCCCCWAGLGLLVPMGLGPVSEPPRRAVRTSTARAEASLGVVEGSGEIC